MRGSSSANISCPQILEFSDIDDRISEFKLKRCSINTESPSPKLLPKKNDYRTPSSFYSKIWIRNRYLLWLIYWNSERVFRCRSMLVLHNPVNLPLSEAVVQLYSHWYTLFSLFDSIGSLTIALGRALACAGRTLVYGGGSSGIMGVVSGEVLLNGGKVVGVLPRDMVASGGEGKEADNSKLVFLNEVGREKVLFHFPC